MLHIFSAQGLCLLPLYKCSMPRLSWCSPNLLILFIVIIYAIKSLIVGLLNLKCRTQVIEVIRDLIMFDFFWGALLRPSGLANWRWNCNNSGLLCLPLIFIPSLQGHTNRWNCTPTFTPLTLLFDGLHLECLCTQI